MGRFVHCNVQYFYFYFLMNHCNDFAPCGALYWTIKNSEKHSYSYIIHRRSWHGITPHFLSTGSKVS